MRHAHVKAGMFALETYNYAQAVDGTVESVSWNPPVQGGHFQASFYAKACSVTLSLSGSYTPVEGDMITLTVNSAVANVSNVIFFESSWDFRNTPVTFVCVKHESGTGVTWRILEQNQNNLDQACARAYSRINYHTIDTVCSTAPNASNFSRINYACKVKFGDAFVVQRHSSNGSSPPNTRMFFGEPSDVNTIIQDGTGPRMVRRVYYKSTSTAGYYAIGEPLAAGTTDIVMKYTGSGTWSSISLPNNFHRHTCPPVVTHPYVIMSSGGDATGIFYSANYGDSWTRVSTVSADRVYVDSMYLWIACVTGPTANGPGVWRATHAAPTVWTKVLGANTTYPGSPTFGLPVTLCNGLANVTGSTGIVAGDENSLYYSVDGGSTWTAGWGGSPIYEAVNAGTEIVGLSNVTGVNTQLMWTRDWRVGNFKIGAHVPIRPGYTSTNALDYFYLRDWEVGADGLYLVSGDESNVGYRSEEWDMPCTFRYFPFPAFGYYNHIDP